MLCRVKDRSTVFESDTLQSLAEYLNVAPDLADNLPQPYSHIWGMSLNPHRLKYKASFLETQKLPNLPINQSLCSSQGILTMQYVATLQPGNIFGEQALESQRPRAATVITDDSCLVAELMKNSFEDLIAEGVKDEIEARLGFLLSQVFKE